MAASQQPPHSNPFNLSIDELRIIGKYRTLPAHQRKGIQQAMERIRPGVAPTPRRRFRHR